MIMFWEDLLTEASFVNIERLLVNRGGDLCHLCGIRPQEDSQSLTNSTHDDQNGPHPFHDAVDHQ